MKTLLQLNRELLRLKEEEKAIKEAYTSAMQANDREQKFVREQIFYAKASVNADMIEMGKSILDLRFPELRQGGYGMIYESLITDAKQDLATGCKKLKTVYFGQKRYEGFDQREDHKYGYGPRHGYIYQSIGLRNPERELSDEQIEACLYTLENIDVVLKALNHRICESLEKERI